ncbi:hypothetical protein ES319_D09G181500v1 [Gossypium barbadense]|uniref:Uncharacterized protein n=1 Tax=Gossypium barbadense TaxID=3634 RepID=A0A5J5Q722_GOSBA|nr:hypothetical protein ES319_D09G181500v1 [Gossypium barbadense]
MAFYVDEENVWKCAKHPSKRRHSGICPVCLQDKLASLCPDCAYTLPCACTATSSSSSYSSFSCFSTAADVSGVGAVGRVSNLSKTPSFWTMFSRASNKSKRFDSEDHGREVEKESAAAVEDERKRRTMMRKSRSVAMTSNSGIGDLKSSTSTKGKGWHFTSPMKAWRQTRVSKLVFQQHSPLYRG